MRGTSDQQIESLVALTPEDLVPQEHPIQRIKPLADRVLQELSPTFSRMYAKGGRPSVPPEHLLKASFLIALSSVRSERQFWERLTYDMLFPWFLDLNIRGGSFDQSTFAKNRTRLLAHEVTGRFFGAVVSEARRQRLLSEEHFSVDGTLLEAWASLKSVRPRDEEGDPPMRAGGWNPWKDFRGERRSNATHLSTTDPEALLARKGQGQAAKLSFAGHVLMENRHGLVVDVVLSQATGTAETEAAMTMLERVPTARRITVGADKGYDTREFMTTCRSFQITPHVAMKQRRSALDRRTSRHAGYAASQRVRKRVADEMPEPEAPAARSGATQGAASSESASNGASMSAPAPSLFPKLAFFISLLGMFRRSGEQQVTNQGGLRSGRGVKGVRRCRMGSIS